MTFAAAAAACAGYSGAGTTPSDKNDPARLRDNVLPYALTGHIHEREVGFHCGLPVAFMPHVAPFFQGISLTVTGAAPTAGLGWAASAGRRARQLARVAQVHPSSPLVSQGTSSAPRRPLKSTSASRRFTRGSGSFASLRQGACQTCARMVRGRAAADPGTVLLLKVARDCKQTRSSR